MQSASEDERLIVLFIQRNILLVVEVCIMRMICFMSFIGMVLSTNAAWKPSHPQRQFKEKRRDVQWWKCCRFFRRATVIWISWTLCLRLSMEAVLLHLFQHQRSVVMFCSDAGSFGFRILKWKVLCTCTFFYVRDETLEFTTVANQNPSMNKIFHVSMTSFFPPKRTPRRAMNLARKP